MKVLFSNPPWWVGKQKLHDEDGVLRDFYTGGVRAGSRWPFTKLMRSSPDRYQYADYTPYPFFMGYAATYLQKAIPDVQVRFRDSIAIKESYKKWIQYVQREAPNYFVFESASPSWEHDSALLLKLHKHFPQMKIVVTGPIVANAKKIMHEVPVHACIKGEYEKGIVRVLEGEEGILEHDLLTKKEMNDAPFPWYDELHALRYWDGCPHGQVPPHAHVWSSRGCPYKCIFCVWPATMTGNDPDGLSRRTVRHYTPEYMEAFLTELVSKYNYQSIYFDDDTFNLGNRHVVKMCEVMQKINLPWSAMCRADTIKMETWKLMKDSGCFGVKLGFESGNQRVVNQIVNKHLDLEYSKGVVHHLKEIGMTVHGTFTYGLPGETKEDMMDTKSFIASLPFDSIQESGTAEIEGTPLSTLSEKGYLEAYEGAVIDESYQRDSNGSQKWQKLSEELRGR